MGEIIDRIKGKAKQVEGIITGDKARQQEGKRDEGLARVREAIAANPGWAELLPRLSPEVAPAAPDVCAALEL